MRRLLLILICLVCLGCQSAVNNNPEKFSAGDRVQHVLTKREGIILRAYRTYGRGGWAYDVRFARMTPGVAKEVLGDLYNESDVMEFELEKVEK